MSARYASGKEGFTLVEILIVVAIIGILAGVTLVAMSSARFFVGSATARQRVDDVAQCLEIYKQKYGEYPPDYCASDKEIQRHILKRWPNSLKSGNMSDMVGVARDEMDKGPGWTLVFWLAGMNGEGFLADQKNPIAANPGSDEAREDPIIELSFDGDGSGGGNYNDRLGLMFKNRPIAYFRANASNGKGFEYDGESIDCGEYGVAAPYMKNGAWFNADSFQLIYPGDDGSFGANDPPRDLGGGDHSNYSQEDKDNAANFTSGATLESEID